MLLHERSVAGSLAVVCFFGVALVGWVNGLSPDVCTQRALIGAVVMYIGGRLAVKAVNAVLTRAMIDYLTKPKEGQAGDNKS